MAQTGYTPISIYYSSTASNTPTAGNLVAGELAINTADGKLFYKDSSGVVQVIASRTGVAGGSNTQVQYNSSGSLAGSANFTYASGQLLLGQTVAGNAQNLILENSSTTGTVTSSLAFTSSGSAKASITSAVYGNGYMDFAVNSNTFAMRIDASGNVGIGTNSPSCKFHVYDGTNDVEQKIQTAGTTKASYLSIISTIAGYGGIQQYTNGTMEWKIDGGGSSGVLSFKTGSSQTERVRIDSSGNVFVGGTTQNTANTPVYAKTSAKAFVNFGGSNGGINAAFNVSSVTYNGTGDYTINFTNALQDNSYTLVGSAQEVAGSGLPTFSPYQTSPFTTTTARVRTALGGTSLINSGQVFAVVYR